MVLLHLGNRGKQVFQSAVARIGRILVIFFDAQLLLRAQVAQKRLFFGGKRYHSNHLGVSMRDCGKFMYKPRSFPERPLCSGSKKCRIRPPYTDFAGAEDTFVLVRQKIFSQQASLLLFRGYTSREKGAMMTR